MTRPAEEAPVLDEREVEESLTQPKRGASVLGLAREYDADPQTIRPRAPAAATVRASRA